MRAPGALLDTVLNLSRYHREHEKFYAQAPLESAIRLQRAARVLKTLADRWSEARPAASPIHNPYAGCEDLNEPAAIQQDGVLFLEGEGEPAELARLKRDLGITAADFMATGDWLDRAMQASWDAARALLRHPPLAEVLGDRHRIIANDWQNAAISTLVGRLIRRALEILEEVDLAPAALRGDLAGPRVSPDYLNSAAELLDRAADLVAESATIVHDNDRRWRTFRARLHGVTEAGPEAPAAP